MRISQLAFRSILLVYCSTVDNDTVHWTVPLKVSSSEKVNLLNWVHTCSIQGPPTARSPTPNITGVSGGELVMPCPIAGYPLTRVTWSLHSKLLTPHATGRVPGK